MAGTLGAGGVTPNVQNGTTPLAGNPLPGPATPPVSKYDIISQQLFSSVNYDDFIRTKLTATAFLGRQVANIHPETVNTLQAAQANAIQSQGASYQGPIVSSTLRRKKAMHAFGMAIDFDVANNPYILDEAGEAQLDTQLIQAYNHIANFILGKAQSDIPLIRKGRSAFGDGSVGAVYDALEMESNAMKSYFALMNNSEDLSYYLSKVWPQNHQGQTAPSATQIQAQMESDYQILGGAGPSGKKLPSKGGDRPFAPSSGGGQGDPASGFLSLDKEFVLAMTNAGFAWGAIDFGAASGDMQHFDTRKLTTGRQVLNMLLKKF